LGKLTNLTSGRLLARNTLINLGGEALPFLVALFVLPVLIRSIGVDRYGVLTLSMIVVGYFGLFDFGLDRAATKLIAEAAGSGGEADIPGLFWVSLFLMLAFGAVAAVLVAALAPWLVLSLLKIPPALRPESRHDFYLLALAMPFVISGGSLGGTLSAFQRFDLINAVRVPTGIFSYLGLLLVLPFSHRLGWLVAILVVGRLAGWLATFILCMRVIPALRHTQRPRRFTIWPMLSFGGWVTVSCVVSPIMVYFDRFLIGAMLSMAAVSYYAVPFQIAGKLWVLPGAMGGVVFAAFSGSFTQDPARAALIFERAGRYTALALFPPVLLIVAFAPEGLSLWLGPSFATHGAAVLRWIAAAAFLNCLAWTPYGLVQAAHRPDLTAKLYLAEVPFYLALLYWMLPRYGIDGAAVAYTARVAADAIVLFLTARRLMPRVAFAVKRIGMLTCVALPVVSATAMPMDLAVKCSLVAVILALFVAAGWAVLLEPEERDFVRDYLRIARVLAVETRE
jgi:O-antigen/teichoic acid export membrane protein